MNAATRARYRAEGRCHWCPDAAISGGLCPYHTLKLRRHKRAKNGNDPWAPGSPGRKPLFTDAELEAMIQNGRRPR